MVKVTEVWTDLDGVLAAFDSGVERLTGKKSHELPKRDMWKAIAKAKTFFEDLEKLPDADLLFDYLKSIEGVTLRVLTGMPGISDGANQKKRWVAKHLCPNIEVIVLPSKDKHLHSGVGKVLIDDRADLIAAWNAAGGIGILHTDSEDTIDELLSIGL